MDGSVPECTVEPHRAGTQTPPVPHAPDVVSRHRPAQAPSSGLAELDAEAPAVAGLGALERALTLRDLLALLADGVRESSGNLGLAQHSSTLDPRNGVVSVRGLRYSGV
jgi:hypothetical protein